MKVLFSSMPSFLMAGFAAYMAPDGWRATIWGLGCLLAFISLDVNWPDWKRHE